MNNEVSTQIFGAACNQICKNRAALLNTKLLETILYNDAIQLQAPDIIVPREMCESLIKGIDLEGDGYPHPLLSQIIIQDKQKGAGRRALTALETEYRDALCLAVRQAVYVIQALGYTPKQAKGKVSKELSTLTVKEAIENGGKVCSSRLNVESKNALKQTTLSQFKTNEIFKGQETDKYKLVRDELAVIEILNLAYLRALSKMGKMYNAQK